MRGGPSPVVRGGRVKETTAIALFAYNRVDLLERTLAALRQNDVPVIYAFSDGPRTAADIPNVDAVRRVLRGVTWTEIEIVERTQNFGLGKSILAGVTDVLRNHDSVITVEDDLVAAPGTYAWMASALRHYRDDPRVMTVSGWTHPRVTPDRLNGAPFFSGRVNTLFWGTWARAWDGMLALQAREMLVDAGAAGIDVDAYGVDLRPMADVEAQRNIWAVRLIAHQLSKRGLCLQPAQSLVRHIGYDARASNAAAAAGWDAPAAAVAPAPGVWPEPREHPDVAALWYRATVEDATAPVDAPLTFPGRVARALAWRTRRAATVVRHLPFIAWTLVGTAMLRVARMIPFDEARVHGVHPVRHYWNEFLATYRADIRGRALEIGDTKLVCGFGGAAIGRADALDVKPGPGIDVVADLQTAWHVPGETYDVFVNQFSMHVIEEDLAALYHSVRLLKPGGVLLINFPCVSSYPWEGLAYGDERSFVQRWYAPAGVRRLLRLLGLAEHSTVETYGSTLGLLAYLAGLPVEALSVAWFRVRHPGVPILVCARVQRPAHWDSPWVPPGARDAEPTP
jgi:SAM-dependent methyltransferase